jgi:tryptophan synthase beta chain
MSDTVKYLLDETRLPKDWYNIVADLPRPPEPVLHPGTLQPVGPQDLEPLFPMELIQQEVSAERAIEIPEPVREVYRQWRPSPLYRARRLEKTLDTPARIYYKYEGVSPAGSHKPNTAVAQAFYNREAGVKRLTTETGAGQWGSALAFAGAVFGLDVRVYMVRVSFDQKPYRKAMMEAWGAQCVASPSGETNAGRRVLAEHPNSPGSLGIAISEAVEVAAQHAAASSTTSCCIRPSSGKRRWCSSRWPAIIPTSSWVVREAAVTSPALRSRLLVPDCAAARSLG